MSRITIPLVVVSLMLSTGLVVATEIMQSEFFVTSDRCVACHNNLVTEGGEDISIGQSWSATMMANAAKDPYWQASVRREVTDHPQASAAIEDKCATCHMPMSRVDEVARGETGRLFEHLPAAVPTDNPADHAARDGVSCSLCHQIQAENLGNPSSFTGGFTVDQNSPLNERKIHGPFDVSKGSERIMSSASGFVPGAASHIKEAAFCATCHTLYIHALDSNGREVGELPEQVPYLEWLHSDYSGAQSCQECHMPVADGQHPISSVLGKPRKPFTKHAFRGGNFFMQKLLAANRHPLGVTASPMIMDRGAAVTADFLANNAAELSIHPAQSGIESGVLKVVVQIDNLAGHKLPTAYPSRRAWVHLTVTGTKNAKVFESGRLREDGSIEGNDNDRDGSLFEPHYRKIDDPTQVQIYEAIMATPDGQVTTGLLRAVSYVKDNRLLPSGFDKSSTQKDIAVHGAAAGDDSFRDNGDTIHYSVKLGKTKGPFRVQAELWYQPIGFRWARNLADYQGGEPESFIAMYAAVPKQNTVQMLAEDKREFSSAVVSSDHPD